MMNRGRVRPYRASDRSSIEDISFRAGFMGESAERFWSHRPSSASIWIAPYLEREPESTFVGTSDGRVVGYLTGCADTARFEGPDAILMREVARYKLMFRPGVAGFLWRAIADGIIDKWRGHPMVRGELHDARWPAHLHINLLPEARGTGLGRELMEAWFARLRTVGSPGCHLGAIAENQRAIGFFEAMGFRAHGRAELIQGMRGFSGERLHQQMMVREIEPA